MQSVFAVLCLLAVTAVMINADTLNMDCTCSGTVSQTKCGDMSIGGLSCSCDTNTVSCSVDSGTGSYDCGSLSQAYCDSLCAVLCADAGATGEATGGGSCDCSSSSSKCFPASAAVQLQNGHFKTMAELNVKDQVLVDVNTYSDIYMFSHRYAAINATFVSLKTDHSSTPLLLTADHYLYVNDKLATAQTVKVGDKLTTGNGQFTIVTAVGQATAAGLYNPHTLHGDIVVNGIKTSSYTASIAPELAHAALWPVRMAYKAGVDVVGNAFNEGSDLLAGLLPDGKQAY